MLTLQTALNWTATDDNAELKASVIIVCGGSSSRMNGIDKIFAKIGNMPVVAKTISAFESLKEISKIVIVTKEESILSMQKLCDEYNFKKVSDIVVGGACREESVYNGFKMLIDEEQIVLIHDGARPFVSNEVILRVLSSAKEYSAATCAVNVKDTVKIVKTDGLIVSTPDRSGLKAVQTPQGFKHSLFKEAIEAADDLSKFTDDCSLVEAYGHPVYTVEGDYNNIKITTEDDLEFANYLETREGK